jgi:acetate kinase
VEAHNPANVTGIRVARALLPDVLHVAVFDTVFFRTLPAASTYAIDATTAHEYGIRRYGFHGTSHEYLSRPVEEVNQIVHLGTAPARRHPQRCRGRHVHRVSPRSRAGTRRGDVDPGVLIHAMCTGLSRTSCPTC